MLEVRVQSPAWAVGSVTLLYCPCMKAEKHLHCQKTAISVKMIRKVFITVVVAVSVYWVLPSRDQFQPEMLVGKKVVVTGASSGIGEQIAYHYARMGANVFITARRKEQLKQVMERCKLVGRKGSNFGYFPADMANLNGTSGVIQKAVDTLGGIDHLVLNHASFSGVGTWKGTADNLTMIQRRMDVNFSSFIHLFSHALPHLLKGQNPAIAVVTSASGRLPNPFNCAYAASKFALEGFFTSIGEEFRLNKCNITTTICPLGFIDTEAGAAAHREFFTALGYDHDVARSIVRPASPEDAAFQIVRSTTLGEIELYYPPWNLIKYLVLSKHLFP